MEITKTEELFVEVMRANQSRKIIGLRKQWRAFGRCITFSWRSRKNPMGRFGGGWQWKIGVQIGGRTTIVSMLICELRFDPQPNNYWDVKVRDMAFLLWEGMR